MFIQLAVSNNQTNRCTLDSQALYGQRGSGRLFAEIYYCEPVNNRSWAFLVQETDFYFKLVQGIAKTMVQTNRGIERLTLCANQYELWRNNCLSLSIRLGLIAAPRCDQSPILKSPFLK